MRAFGISHYGGIDSVQEFDRPRPVPTDNEVVIDLVCASVNPVDYKITEGRFSGIIPERWPVILGWDGAGVVSSVGRRVTNFQQGDSVYAYVRKDFLGDGTFAEAIAVDASVVAKIPTNLSFAEAAAFPLAALTAWQGLFEHADLRGGQTVLIHAGAGAVGSFALQFARWKGATCLTTASADNHAYVRTRGAVEAFDYHYDDFAARIHEIYPEGVDLVFDTVGGTTQERSWEVLKRDGRMVTLLALGPLAKEHPDRATGFLVHPDGSQLATIADLVQRELVIPPEIRVLPLDQIKTALNIRKENRPRGKLILAIT